MKYLVKVWIGPDNLIREEDAPKLIRINYKERTSFNSMKLIASCCYLVGMSHEIDE